MMNDNLYHSSCDVVNALGTFDTTNSNGKYMVARTVPSPLRPATLHLDYYL